MGMIYVGIVVQLWLFMKQQNSIWLICQKKRTNVLSSKNVLQFAPKITNLHVVFAANDLFHFLLHSKVIIFLLVEETKKHVINHNITNKYCYGITTGIYSCHYYAKCFHVNGVDTLAWILTCDTNTSLWCVFFGYGIAYPIRCTK
jgi:hypothetical protein